MTPKTILVVDDSKADQFLAKLAITAVDPDICILQTFDGREALELLDSARDAPDVILLDINMPSMGGHEFLAHYATREEQSSVVVMLSSSMDPRDKEQAMVYDFVISHLQKPLLADKLEGVIGSLDGRA